MASLANWITGWVAFNLLVVILLIGMGGVFASEHDLDNVTFNASLDTDDVADRDDFSIWDNFSWSITGLPWWIDSILIMNVVTGIVLFALYLRGAN